MNRTVALASLLLGGFTATIALTSNMPGNFAIITDSSRVDVLVYSAAAGATLGAITAAFTVILARRRRTLASIAALGLVLLAVTSFHGFWQWEFYPQRVGAGALLGALAGLCNTRDRPMLQTALAAGAVGGLLLSEPIDEYRSAFPRRYADYLPADYVSAAPDAFMLSLLSLTVVALLVAIQRGAFGVPDPARADGRVRELAVGVAVPVAGLLLHWSLVRAVQGMSTTEVTQERWLFGLAVTPVFVAGALWLPRRQGMVLLAALAFIAAASGGVRWSSDSWPSLLIPAMLVVLGAVFGRRWPSPLVGVAALALVAASAVFDEQPWDTVHIGGAVLLLPFAAGFTVAACLPSSAPATTISLAAPAAVTVPLITQFGWTAYTPLTPSRTALSSSAWQWTSTGVTVAAVLISGAAIAWLQRRPAEKPPSVEAPM
ncbi:hypothetical protein OG921_26370 [Aldersonia sp. NBC_00410]|uniref:hypothetical protein n=1 Tax=Aldersonia sp. NBC_00410 TaxID=2975954 RepID=UPI002251642F|nr:hypothetical protein [Aldersonia sp. NBC_00410]MCX5046705.1 hypothetical protein [Aldersonia sp. NBC_00410]